MKQMGERAKLGGECRYILQFMKFQILHNDKNKQLQGKYELHFSPQVKHHLYT